MPPLTSHFRRRGVQDVTVVRGRGTEDEQREVVQAHMQADSGFFAVETPIFEGDHVEYPDPRGHTASRLVTKVEVNDPKGSHLRSMAHTKAEFGPNLPPRLAAVRRLTFENLHEQVREAAGDLYADGHYEQAISEAAKSVDVRVRNLIGSENSGAPLVGEAFGGGSPRIDLADSPGRSGQDEREGFQAILRGVMQAVRNPRAHELLKSDDPQLALEYLGMLSLLHRRLDGRQVRPASTSGGSESSLPASARSSRD